MKNLLITLFLLITLNLSSQPVPKFPPVFQIENDSTLTCDSLLIYLDENIVIPLVDSMSYNETDTIRVVFLLCDTTMVEDRWSKYIPIDQTELVWWEYGYIVQKYWEVEFLNNEKQKFNKDILIWDYRQL